jgi:hypothetical protein
MRANLRGSFALSSLLLLAACGGGVASVPTQVGPTAPPAEGAGGGSSSTFSKPASPVTTMPADPHGLAISAAACWFGGVWGDALGEAIERKAMDEQRCLTVVRAVWGDNDKGHFEQLRALEAHAVEDVIAKVGGDSAPGKELRAFADAQREALDARRAGDKVRRDVAREPDKLTADEATAVVVMANGKALEALLHTDDGDLTHEVHALGVMTAMERLDRSRGLPKHLKVYAMQAPMASLFGVAAPAMPTDATKPLIKGVYLTYVVDAAKGAGHPVPDTAKTPKDREAMAWGGILQGISDKLKPDVDAISKDTPFADIVVRVTNRLAAQYQGETSALASKTVAPGKAPSMAPAKAPAAVLPSKTPGAPAKPPTK